ncbi:MAG: hypothetical protein ACYSP9_04555, partial [Planctomycetota bacterium]
ISPEVSSAKFHENISDFAVVYGLGIQLLGEAMITGNLLPRKIARAMTWRRKGKLFTIAASVLLCVSILSFARASHERGKYARGNSARKAIKGAISAAQSASSSLKRERGKEAVLQGKMRKEMSYFKSRDVVPLLNETIIGCLPNEQNNLEQAELYEAFSSNDVERVVSFARDARKQLLVTGVSVNYAESLASAQFGQIKKRTGSKSSRSKGRTGGRMRGRGRFGRSGARFGGATSRFTPAMGRTSAQKTVKGKTQTGKDGPGFLVIIEGYSPYKNINELLDPPGVGNDPSKWGLVTRLENLAKVMPDAPFELLEKSVTHFKCETGEVDLNLTDMPVGIGVERDIERVPRKEKASTRTRVQQTSYGRGGQGLEDRITVEKVLIDPMTSEEMSKTFDLITQEEVDGDPSKSERDLGKKKYTDFGQPKYIVRDHWFRVKAKFLWKGAAKPEAKSGPKAVTYRKG